MKQNLSRIKRVKRPAKKSTTTPIAGVVIRDTPVVFVSMKKAPAKADRSKGIEILFDVALSEGESKDDNDDLNDDDNDDDNAIDDDSEGDDDKANSDIDCSDAHDSERTDSGDDDGNPSFTLKDYDEEEHDEEYKSDDDYEYMFEEEDDDLCKDVDVRSLGAKNEKEMKDDKVMTDADQNVSQEKSYEKVIKDTHVTLTFSQKIQSSKQSSLVSSDFASKFLNLEMFHQPLMKLLL
nr:hypothetical protein [Tanacetum cinerariifolium]